MEPSDLQQVVEKSLKAAEETDKVSVRIAFFGQPGSGKSSLINALVGEEIARVSEQTDETKTLEEYTHEGLTLCDLPGYGTSRFPADTYFDKFNIAGFDLILCVSAGKFSANDTEFYRRLRALGKACIFVRNKSDALYQNGLTEQQLMDQIVSDLERQIDHHTEVVFTSCRFEKGLDYLERVMAARLPEVKRDRFFRDAKAYSKEFLDKKRAWCRKHAIFVAGTAATINMAPVPGTGVAADIAAIVRLFGVIRSSFNLSQSSLLSLENAVPLVSGLAKDAIQYLSTDGIKALLARYSKRVIVSEAARYTPFVGSIIAGSLSFLTVKLIADQYIEICYKLAEARLEEELKARRRID
jgi:hypothetical protein